MRTCGGAWEVLLFNKFFFRLSIRALGAKIQPDKVVRWCADGKFLAIFYVLYFQQAACSMFQTASYIRTEATPRVEVWQTSNLQWLKLGEEKKIERRKNKKERRYHRMKI